MKIKKAIGVIWTAPICADSTKKHLMVVNI